MGFSPLLLFLLSVTGCISKDTPEMLQATAGDSISLQCRYNPEDVRSRKVWCQFLLSVCQPLVTSVVDRRAMGSGKAHLTDLGEGLLAVVMEKVQVEDTGKYGCIIEGPTGIHILHTFILKVSPPEPRQDKEDKEDYERGGTFTSAPVGYPTSSPNLSPMESNQEDWRISLIWGSVFFLGLLFVALVALVVMTGRMGSNLDICGQSQSRDSSALDTMTPTEEPSNVPYIKLGSPPSLDDTTYTNLPLDPPSGKPPPPPPPMKSDPRVHFNSMPVTYASVVFPPGAEGEQITTQSTQEQTDLKTPSI